MRAKDFFASPNVIELVKRYDVFGEDIDSLFEKSVADLAVKNCIISVLGTQGSGKSSFLNALLFGDIVLPVDADETTCIPTAVSYADLPAPQATVVFKDGRKKNIECTEESLANFVHQDKNPGNRLKVSQVKIKMRHPLLKSGVTLVDLPGIGSITRENQQVAMDYLKSSTAAIFMLRTVPPITGREGLFIQGALPLMGRAFWVQNQWYDESVDEVRVGLARNHEVLLDIAKKLHLPAEVITIPTVVNVKQALDGRITANDIMISASGITEFQSTLTDFVRSWSSLLEKGKISQAVTFLEFTKKAAQERRKLLAGDIDRQLSLIQEEKQRAEENQRNNRSLCDSALDYLDQQKEQISFLIDTQTRISAENLRNAVRETIDNGVVGGWRLNRAFSDHQKKESERLFGIIQEAFNNVMVELCQKLDDLQDCRFGKENKPVPGVTPDFSDKTNAPHYYGRIGGGALGIGGMAGGAYVGGLIGTAIPGPGTAIGMAIGGVIGGLLGGLGGWFGGAKLGKVQIASQQNKAKQELFKIIEEYQKNCNTNYKKIFYGFKENIDKSVPQWLSAQDKLIDKKFQETKRDLSRPAEEKQVLLAQIAEDLKRIDKLTRELTK